jgi:hypothetical protein
VRSASEAQAVFCRRRHHPTSPPLAKIRPGQARTPETHASHGVLTVEGQHACKRVGD